MRQRNDFDGRANYINRVHFISPAGFLHLHNIIPSERIFTPFPEYNHHFVSLLQL